MYRYFFFLIVFISHFASAQILEPAKWAHSTSKTEVKIGEEVELIFRATIEKDWYLYSSDFDPDLGPTVTTFEFKPNDTYERIGDIKPINPKKKFDDIWGGDYTYFVGTGEFRQTVKILKNNPKIEGSYNYQVCTDITGKCIPFDEDFLFDEIKVVKDQASQKGEPKEKEEIVTNQKPKETLKTDVLTQKIDTAKENVIVENNLEEDGKPNVSVNIDTVKKKSKVDLGDQPKKTATHKEMEKDLFVFFFVAFGSGLIALLTPCVFPMIPMTVSFFSHSAKTKAQSFSMSIVFGISIILIYILIGFLTSIIFGPEVANFLSTHWIPNVAFFIIFVVFAISFFGAFEITLPASFVNTIDRKADQGGYIGVFFMAFTLALVSFSCTGPIVGSILVASAGGQVLMPLVGMAGFSMAFAIPFTLFAAFPSWLKGLPQSGGWLNSVKVVLGFLEIALAFKFLSIADQTYHWGILDRDIYITIWIVDFAFMGLYLLGKIRLPHDAPIEKLGVGRMLMSLATFVFVLYLIPGLFGAPLKALSGYLPPQNSHDFDLNAIIRENSGGGGHAAAISDKLCDAPKYSDFLHLPHGLVGYYDYEQALQCAKEKNMPIFIDFTGHGCVNCREMEANVWSDPRVLKKLREEFIMVALYVDDKTDLPEESWYKSEYDGKLKKSIGKQNADLQIVRFNNNAQPYYCLLDTDGDLLIEPKAYDLNVQSFIDFLDAGLAEFHAHK